MFQTCYNLHKSQHRNCEGGGWCSIVAPTANIYYFDYSSRAFPDPAPQILPVHVTRWTWLSISHVNYIKIETSFWGRQLQPLFYCEDLEL